MILHGIQTDISKAYIQGLFLLITNDNSFFNKLTSTVYLKKDLDQSREFLTKHSFVWNENGSLDSGISISTIGFISKNSYKADEFVFDKKMFLDDFNKQNFSNNIQDYYKKITFVNKGAFSLDNDTLINENNPDYFHVSYNQNEIIELIQNLNTERQLLLKNEYNQRIKDLEKKTLELKKEHHNKYTKNSENVFTLLSSIHKK